MATDEDDLFESVSGENDDIGVVGRKRLKGLSKDRAAVAEEEDGLFIHRRHEEEETGAGAVVKGSESIHRDKERGASFRNAPEYEAPVCKRPELHTEAEVSGS